VKIKASGTDKQKRRNLAIEMAKLKLIDPLSFYEDMDLNDPEGRTEKMMMMQMDPAGYMMKFVMNMTPEQGAQALMNAPMPGQPQPPAPGGPAPYINPPKTNAQQPIPGNTAQVATEPPVGPPAASPQGGI
jgi:hypothetical protein